MPAHIADFLLTPGGMQMRGAGSADAMQLSFIFLRARARSIRFSRATYKLGAIDAQRFAVYTGARRR